jgi:DnaJ-class molecular chaperone
VSQATNKCDYCNGFGGGYRVMHFAPLDETTYYEKCPKCKGSGRQPMSPDKRVMEAADIGVKP